MSIEIIEAVEAILDEAIAETSESETSFKLRQASQLLRAIEEQRDEAVEAIERDGFERTVREELRQLGYLS